MLESRVPALHECACQPSQVACPKKWIHCTPYQDYRPYWMSALGTGDCPELWSGMVSAASLVQSLGRVCRRAVAARWPTGNLESLEVTIVGVWDRAESWETCSWACPQFPRAPPPCTPIWPPLAPALAPCTCGRDALPDPNSPNHHVGDGAVLLHHQTRLCDASVREHAAACRQTRHSLPATTISTNAYILQPAVYQHHYPIRPPHPLLPIHPSQPCFYASANKLPLSDQVPQSLRSRLSLSTLSFYRSTKQRNRYIASVTGCAVFSAIDGAPRTGPTATPSRPRSPPLLLVHAPRALYRARDNLSGGFHCNLPLLNRALRRTITPWPALSRNR